MARAHYTNLRQAFQAHGTLGRDFTISNELINMFRRQSTDPFHDDTNAINRFEDAKRIYDSIRINNPTHSVFYALSDHAQSMTDYHNAHIQVRNTLRAELLRRPPATADELNQIINDVLYNLSIGNAIEQNLHHYYTTGGRRDTLYRWIAAGQLDQWFDHNDIVADVRDIGANIFYGVPDWRAAKATGLVYNPTDHNWGVNVGWLLGIIDNSKSVLSLSEINLEHRNRAPSWGDPPFPSAFALEIAVALKAGYTLEYTAATNTPILRRPAHLTALDINGLEGSGLLPSRTMQLVLYQEVMNNIQLGVDIVDWRPTLAPVAEDFITASSNALNLTAYLTNIRTVASGPVKQRFVAAIETMRQVGELAPVLANFSGADHVQLRTLLTTAPFAGDANYNNLRQTALAADLEHRRTTHPANFRIWFSGICNGHDNDAKQNLVDALDFMGYAGTLQTALTSLTRTQHDELNNLLLRDPLFAGAHYDPMRDSAKKALWANYMGTVSRNDAAAFNTWIRDICTGVNADNKKSLVETLEVMRGLNTLAPVLASLIPARHAELRAVLTAAPFAGDANYNHLRQTARTAESTALAADLNQQRNRSDDFRWGYRADRNRDGNRDGNRGGSNRYR